MIAFSGPKMVGPRPDWGLIQNSRRAFPPLSYGSPSPGGGAGFAN